MSSSQRQPILRRLVTLGLASSEDDARRLIEEKVVLVQGSLVDNPSRLVASGDPIELVRPDEYVSRGGIKLAHALDHFAVDPRGRVALDVGASTGGFTDCLLQRGAHQVFALDVGATQLHEKLRVDDRVVVVADFNARDLADQQRCQERGLPTPIDLVVVDVSFISVAQIASGLASVAAPGADVVVLVKPQFEATKAEADRGAGVIRETAIHERVVGEVVRVFGAVGLHIVGVIESPITGASGNTEFLAHFRMTP